MNRPFADYVQSAKTPLSAPLAGFPGVALTNSTVADNLQNVELQVRTLIELNRELESDIIFPMMDLTVETEALGGNVSWSTDEMPTVQGIAVASEDDADALVVPEIGVGNRLGVFVETCRELKRAFPEKLVWAYALGPFSIAGRLVGMTEAAIAIKLEPDMMHSVLRKANELLINYINALLDTGVDGLMILEPASGMLRADDADVFSNAYIKDLVAIIKERGRIPALHNCGNINHLIESLCKTGIEALHVGSVSDPYAIYPRIPDNVVLMGNLDPTEVFLRSNPDKVYEKTTELACKMAGFTRFIISSGCDLPSGVSIENIKAFQHAAKAAIANVLVSS